MKLFYSSKTFILAMLLPAILIYTIFFTLPSTLTLFLSFVKWSGFGTNFTFVGLGNYVKSLTDSVIHLSFKNTLTIIFVGGIVNFILAFYLSLALSSGIHQRIKNIYRGIIFLPFIVSVFATVNMWQNLYNPTTGIFSVILRFINPESNFMFTSSENILYAMIIAMIWSNVGFYLVILLSGIDRIPKEMFEAADIEGANSWTKFTKITLPLIWDVVIISLTLWVVLAIKNFEFPYAFGSQNIPQELYNTSVYMYITGFGQRQPIFQMGYASTIGVESILFTFVLVLLIRKVMHRETNEL